MVSITLLFSHFCSANVSLLESPVYPHRHLPSRWPSSMRCVAFLLFVAHVLIIDGPSYRPAQESVTESMREERRLRHLPHSHQVTSLCVGAKVLLRFPLSLPFVLLMLIFSGTCAHLLATTNWTAFAPRRPELHAPSHGLSFASHSGYGRGGTSAIA